jgi:hypothetical protein
MHMNLRLAALSVLGLAGALAAPVQAANSIWDHNGSRMTLEENGEKRKLVYTELREGLDKAGIKKGTVLFNGERKPNGRLAGFAKIFKGTCNPIDYFVEGTLNEQAGEIVLQGQAPVYATGTGCEVSGYSDSSPASTLKFARIGASPESAVVAERAPDQDIEQGDRGPADEYLPPSIRGGNRNTARTEQQPAPAARREASPAPLRNEPQESTGPRREASPAPQRDEPQESTGPRRDSGQTAMGRTDPRDIDESDPDDRGSYYRPRDGGDYRYRTYEYDRRYTRAPDPYQERGYRRRPGIWDPEDEMDQDAYDDYDRRPVSPFWGRRSN